MEKYLLPAFIASLLIVIALILGVFWKRQPTDNKN